MLPGLGLLPVVTTMTAEKTTRQTAFRLKESDEELKGYEIHMGETVPAEGHTTQPLAILDNGKAEGCIVDNRTMGCYLHGILDNPQFADFLLDPFKEKAGKESSVIDYDAFKQRQYDLLADHVRKHLDMNLLYKILQND